MRLITSKEEFSKLTRLQVIEPTSNGYAISIPLDDDSILTLNVSIEDDVPVTETAVKKSTVTVTEEMYKEYLHCFPTDTNAHMENSQYMKAGTNKRAGAKDRIKTRLRLRIEEGLAFEDIVKAVKYEVDWRIKTSTLKESQVQYMNNAEAWLNNINNIEVMLERSKKQGTNESGNLNYTLKL